MPAGTSAPSIRRAPRLMDSVTCAWSWSRRSTRACGPTWVSREAGSPMRRAPSSDLNRSRKRSTTGATTMKRLAAMQLWPLLISRASAAARAAASTSASASTMNGSLPPSSSTVFLSMRPACSATAMPARSTAGERGRDDARVRDELLHARRVRSAPCERGPRGSRRGGRPRSICRAERGTLEACLRMPPLPAMRAGAAKRKTCQTGSSTASRPAPPRAGRSGRSSGSRRSPAAARPGTPPRARRSSRKSPRTSPPPLPPG